MTDRGSVDRSGFDPATVLTADELATSPRRLLPQDVVSDALDAEFWDGCRLGEFRLHRCTQCGRSYWPASSCVDHGGDTMQWVPASGRGTIHTYTVFHQAYDPALADVVPYAVVVVQLEEGPFFHSDLPGCPIDEVAVDLPVEVAWELLDDGTAIPHFRPRSTP